MAKTPGHSAGALSHDPAGTAPRDQAGGGSACPPGTPGHPESPPAGLVGFSLSPRTRPTPPPPPPPAWRGCCSPRCGGSGAACTPPAPCRGPRLRCPAGRGAPWRCEPGHRGWPNTPHAMTPDHWHSCWGTFRPTPNACRMPHACRPSAAMRAVCVPADPTCSALPFSCCTLPSSTGLPGVHLAKRSRGVPCSFCPRDSAHHHHPRPPPSQTLSSPITSLSYVPHCQRR